MSVNVDTTIHNQMLFRLLFGTQDDRYEPGSAHYLLPVVTDLDDKSAQITVILYAKEAASRLDKQIN